MPKIDPTISVGNLLSIATVIVAVVLAYARTIMEPCDAD